MLWFPSFHSTDDDGNMISVSFNNHVRSSFMNIPAEKVMQAYEAFYKFQRYTYAKILLYLPRFQTSGWSQMESFS